MVLSESNFRELVQVRLDDQYQHCPCWTTGLSVRRKILLAVRKEIKKGSQGVAFGHSSFLILVNYTLCIVTRKVGKSNICVQTEEWGGEKEDFVRDAAPQYLLTCNTITDKSSLIASGVKVIDAVPRSKLDKMRLLFDTWEVGPGTRLGIACCVFHQRGSSEYELVSMASYEPERYYYSRQINVLLSFLKISNAPFPK